MRLGIEMGMTLIDTVQMYAEGGAEEVVGEAIATSQVLYNLEQRGIEFDVLPWSQQQQLSTMAYCPIGQGGKMLANALLKQVAARHDVTPAQVALAWILRQDSVIAIPKAVRPEHVRLNAQAALLQLEAGDLEALDQAFRAPQHKQRLAMV